MNEYKQRLNFLKEKSYDDFFCKIKQYKQILQKFNRIHNLTHFANIDENIIDSVKILDFYDLHFAKKIIDVGSGAGFPAVFLACILNESEFFLFEPNAKKASFLRVVKTELGLLNLNIIKEKLQNYPKFKVDLICSRALMDIIPLIGLCKGFYDENTTFLLYKGSQVYEELGQIKNYKIFNDNFRNYCILQMKG
ncbi:16S rRNA (guanine(527)-N(7))-methyltransferase RsmG [Campylobacter volucris]|uniref:16S rRNA (guanine(527)-N(7))-methyltransferase RsmG n=1 Tax=Campylobacter volucris TaxID=1031542 RepID=UPI00189D2022|nr:16S rRNA (guanine(527)-N(7))-methyltransferase RsmG [Campylobacter volucris]MBF7047724.1 16S rRNA (guanine(527)-N(7))-methyltransferase RsmG [Campylobacter volucris]MBF7068511.1 16S rRNA (guanine(527)-N(7))-methyltransferase RsmG [Campylobacter volucris]